MPGAAAGGGCSDGARRAAVAPVAAVAEPYRNSVDHDAAQSCAALLILQFGVFGSRGFQAAADRVLQVLPDLIAEVWLIV